MVNTVKAHPAQPATRRSDLHCTCCGGALALQRRAHRHSRAGPRCDRIRASAAAYYLRYKVPKTLCTDVKTEVKTEILPYVKTEVQVAMYL